MKTTTNQAGARPVPAQLRQVRRGALKAASSLTPVADGDGIGAGRFHLKPRPKGNLAIFNGGDYVVTTGTKDPKKAQDALELHEMQAEAKREGLLDVRYADAVEVLDAFEAVEGRPPKTQGSIKNAFDRLRPYIEGKTVNELNSKWLKRTMEALKSAPHKRLNRQGKPSGFGYAEASRVVSMAWLSVAILDWCAENGAMSHLPYKRPKQPKGRDLVYSPQEQATILRWSRGQEHYDRTTRRWTPPAKPLTAEEIYDRRMIERMGVPSLATASRPGGCWGLARGASNKCPYIDRGTLYRMPLGCTAPDNKRATPVALCAEAMVHVRRWEEEDGPDQPYILYRWRGGGPLSQAACARRWRKAMEKLGIDGRRHTCRHTTVTALVAANVHPLIISSVAAMSLPVIKGKYNHSGDRVMQPWAFPQLDAILTGGIGAGPMATV
jgi:integrase